jgi:hypothetical protein
LNEKPGFGPEKAGLAIKEESEELLLRESEGLFFVLFLSSAPGSSEISNAPPSPTSITPSSSSSSSS